MTTYKDAGVDLEAADEAVNRIRRSASLTTKPGVLAQVGGFAGCFELPTGYKKPVLVTSTDGVGTKLLLALNEHSKLINIGFDLVGMVVNDIACCGAKPLFFLDYFATGKLDVGQVDAVIGGVADACLECKIPLIGGETAEMPGMYNAGDFDIAGFSVGVVEKDQMIDGHADIRDGDVIIGIESSGPHSNGYSLIREIIRQNKGASPETLDRLMAPTLLYSNVVLDLMENGVKLRGIANITGGGFTDNIPRILDKWWSATIDTTSWDRQRIFNWLQKNGNVSDEEMYRTFNMGVGIILVVSQEQQDKALKIIDNNHLKAWKIGDVIERPVASMPQVVLD